jgi:SAM-dependent methyltransferase
MNSFENVYEDGTRAAAYATLGFPGTYYLAFRDLPGLLADHVTGRHALDFGCGTGRSTRFLRSLGFETTGIDISSSMIELAREADPDGEYHLVGEDFSHLGTGSFDLILSAFPFDNIPGRENRARLLRELLPLLRPDGRFVLLGSTPEIYTHEWTSFTTAAFPENATAKSGQEVRIVMKDVADARPVVDVIWFDRDYRELFAAAGLEVIAEHRPLGRDDDGFSWISERSVAPWVIYVTRREG